MQASSALGVNNAVASLMKFSVWFLVSHSEKDDSLVCSSWRSYSHGISWKDTGTVKWTRLHLFLRFFNGKCLKKVEVELVLSSPFLCFLLQSHYLCLAAMRLCVGAAG